ncbi:MAG: hypothetical protein KAR20_15780, partial [Candidatus Heimdallarchaeota archaeon]|nr:hypothetical protein [Candidatus Heimdallarchaeota archaeon]
MRNRTKLFHFIFLFLYGTVFAQQIDIPRIEQMPNQPEPYEMRDWKQVAIDYDNFIFDFTKTGDYLPIMWWDTSRVNFDRD